MKTVASTLGVARSNLIERRDKVTQSRGSYRKAEDASLIPPIRAIIDERPTYGYRRVWALLNRHLRSAGRPKVNMKRVLRIMQKNGLTLERHTARRPGRTHDGVVVALHRNIRWCSDHLELHARNREVVRILFVLDACDVRSSPGRLSPTLASRARWYAISWSPPSSAGSAPHMRPTQSNGCPTTEAPTSPKTLPIWPELSA
jgi:hypothetical protein